MINSYGFSQEISIQLGFCRMLIIIQFVFFLE